MRRVRGRASPRWGAFPRSPPRRARAQNSRDPRWELRPHPWPRRSPPRSRGSQDAWTRRPADPTRPRGIHAENRPNRRNRDHPRPHADRHAAPRRARPRWCAPSDGSASMCAVPARPPPRRYRVSSAQTRRPRRSRPRRRSTGRRAGGRARGGRRRNRSARRVGRGPRPPGAGGGCVTAARAPSSG